MNEKEKQNISNRARNFELSKPLASPHLSYSKGALDQDPISRKAEREKITEMIQTKVEGHPDAHVFRWIIKEIEALP